MDPVATTGWDAQGNPVSPPPAAPPAPQGWDAQGKPISDAGSAAAVTPAPPKPQPAQDLITARFGPAGGEGGYRMHDFAGTPHQVGYSKVHQALDNGFLFADKPALEQYARDHAADPIDESRVDQWIDKHPIVTGPLQGVIGGYRGMIRTGTAFDRPPTTRGETEAQLFAATPNRTWQESAGGLAEAYGEFSALGATPGAAYELFRGEQLLGMLGRAGDMMTAAEKLKTVTGLAQLIEKVPMVGKLLKIGESAAKQGTTSAAQTYINTRGDIGATATAGALGAITGPATELVGATGTALNTLRKGAGAGAGAAATEGETAAATAAREAQATRNVAEADAREAALRTQAEQTAAQSKTAAQQHAAAVRTEAERRVAVSAGAAEQHAATLRTTAERNVAAAQTAAERQAADAEAAAAARAAEGRAAYAEHAREAIRPQLEQTRAAQANVARDLPQQEVMMNQPGGEPAAGNIPAKPTPAAPTGRMAVTATGKPAPQPINVDELLNQTHDLTGAADRLTAAHDEIYNQFDAATNGRFRQLNAQVAEAQNAMRKGEQGAAGLYKQKLAEMDQLMDSTGGQITPEMKAAAKAGFRQSYVLRDFGNLWDRNFGGVPGATQASQTQRGINGKGLLTDLQRAVKLYGRPQIEQALGPGRLESYEEIAQQNVTDAGRKSFNAGLRTVAQELARLEAEHPSPPTTTIGQELARLRAQYPGPQTTTTAQELARLKAQAGPAPAKVAREAARLAAEADRGKPPIPKSEQMSPWAKRITIMAAGAGVGHATGGSPYLGAVTAEALYETSRFVLNSLKTNPKIAQNFLFAIQSGARAERYGPFIASMIQQAVTQSSREEQQRQQEQR